jgi:CBS domain containing-hemolysin-like protein
MLGLLALGGLLSTAYTALSNVRPSSLTERADDGDRRARQILALISGESRLSMTYLLLTTLIQSSLAALTFFTVGLLSDNNLPSMILGVGGMALLMVIFGWSVPEAIGSVYAEPIARTLVQPMTWLCQLFSPITWLLLNVSRVVASTFGGERLVDTVTEEEIMTLVNAGHTGGTIEEDEKTMIYSVLQLDQTNARQLMVPRMDITALDVETPIAEACDHFIATGFSRIPVYEESIDNIVGLLYAKDLLALQRRPDADKQIIRDHLRPAYFVPETLVADELLKSLKKQKIHMAIVVDEFGGTSGLVTIEDLIEEIIGDIVDEYDPPEESEVIDEGEGRYSIDATMNLSDIDERFGLGLDNEETDTLGGFIYAQLGRVPQAGETVEGEEYRLTVRHIEGRRIRRVLLELKQQENSTPSSGDDPARHPPSSALTEEVSNHDP